MNPPHRLTKGSVNTEESTATCSICGPGTKIVWRGNGPGKSRVARCIVPRRRDRNNPARPNVQARGDKIRGLHGVRRGAARQYLLDKVCAICGRKPPEVKLHLDHDHVTMELRGALCARCNLTLAHVEDTAWLEAARSYLADPPGRTDLALQSLTR